MQSWSKGRYICYLVQRKCLFAALESSCFLVDQHEPRCTEMGAMVESGGCSAALMGKGEHDQSKIPQTGLGCGCECSVYFTSIK